MRAIEGTQCICVAHGLQALRHGAVTRDEQGHVAWLFAVPAYLALTHIHRVLRYAVGFLGRVTAYVVVREDATLRHAPVIDTRLIGS